MAGEAETTAPDAGEIENDDDFNAGFTSDADKPTETPAAADATEPKSETATESAPVAEASPPPPPEPKFVQITEDDWNALQSRAAQIDQIGATFDKKLDAVYGKVGRTIEQSIAKLRTETPEGQAVQFDESDFAELAEQYPDLAPKMMPALKKMVERLKGTGSDPAAVEKIVSERVTAATETLRTQLIDASLDAIVGGAWRDEVNTPEFDSWIKVQPIDVRALAESDEFNDAKKMMRLYKQAKDKPPAPPPAPSNTTRARQLAAAVPPKGDGGHPPGPTEDDEFNAGFKSG